MPGHRLPLSESLPRSHYFFTSSRGTVMRTVAIRTLWVRLGLVTAPLLMLVGLGSTLYVAFHDDFVAELMRRQSAQQYAYEDRIEGLRQDLERQTERARTDQAQLDSRLRDIVTRETRLESHAAAVAALAGEVEGPVRRPALPVEVTGSIPTPPAAALGYTSPEKPHPVIEAPARGPAAARGEDHAALFDDPNVPPGERLGAAGLALDRIERRQAATLAHIGAEARRRVARIRAVIEDAGLTPERYLARAPAVGGPFVPLPEGPDGAFTRTVADLRGAVATAAQLGAAIGRLPLAAPLMGRMEVTSPYGARTDPFLGRPALHTGVDLREGYGTEIRATGGGRVSFAGMAGGYGNMVEIDHGNGVSTRYAHMGGIAATEGQTVARGTVLGVVGSTGRATGPHLHYEVRIDGEPVDPTRFLGSAERLASIEAP